MAHISVFDIAGPVMVGPSSSHTAGACKIGQIARALFNTTPEKIIFQLHGSFGQVYKGHATDRALLGGALRYKTSDPRIKEAFQKAKKKKIKYKFEVVDLGKQYHPNTVRIIMQKAGRPDMAVIGSSLGGGMVRIVQIDDFEVEINEVAGRYKTLILCHTHPIAIKKISMYLNKEHIRVVNTVSTIVDDKILTTFDTEGRRLKIPEILDLQAMEGVVFLRSLNKLQS